MEGYDPRWLVRLTEEQQGVEPWLAVALAECTRARVKSKAMIHFVDRRGPTWDFEANIVLESESHGDLVLDVLKGHRIGGVEFLSRGEREAARSRFKFANPEASLLLMARVGTKLPRRRSGSSSRASSGDLVARESVVARLTPEVLGVLATLFVGACGPTVDEDVAELRNSLAGFYSTSDIGRQVDADDTRVSIYEFRGDGAGVLHRLSCIGETSEPLEFDWTLADTETTAQVQFAEGYSALDSDWLLPEPECSRFSSSALMFDEGRRDTIFPGRRCNPQLEPSLPDGLWS